jgi:hypothetical protein
MADFVAYYRVSTDRQGRSGLGLDAQRTAVAAYIAGRGMGSRDRPGDPAAPGKGDGLTLYSTTNAQRHLSRCDGARGVGR